MRDNFSPDELSRLLDVESTKQGTKGERGEYNAAYKKGLYPRKRGVLTIPSIIAYK